MKAYIADMESYFDENPDALGWNGDVEGLMASIVNMQETTHAMSQLPFTDAHNTLYMNM